MQTLPIAVKVDPTVMPVKHREATRMSGLDEHRYQVALGSRILAMTGLAAGVFVADPDCDGTA